MSPFPIAIINHGLLYYNYKNTKQGGKGVDEVIGEVVAGLCEFVVEMTADVVGNLVGGEEKKEKETL